MDEIRYPTGRFTPKGAPLSREERTALTGRIEALPAEITAAVTGLGDTQLDTPYRQGGWSPRQIVHHLADAHLNGFVRFKLAVTEDRPTIKPYDQEAWADQPDVTGVPVEVSLTILEGLHARWARLLRSLEPRAFGRRLVHPEMGDLDVDFLLQLYAWHGHHHTTQVARLREEKGW